MRLKRKNLRLYIIGSVFALITLTIWIRLFQIQVLKHEYYQTRSRKQWARTRAIPASRGSIFDRRGKPLALSSRSFSIYVNPEKARRDYTKVYSELSRISNISDKTLRGKLHSKRGFEWIERKRSLTKKEKEKLSLLQGVGIRLEADRTYPFGRIANKIVGFCGDDNKGLAGIEAAFNRDLQGDPGSENVILDGLYNAHMYKRFPVKKPVNGRNVILTIDAAIQEIAESELEKALKENQARWGAVILMDSKNGEILALAESPSALSRSCMSRVDSLWTIRSVSCVYEPGSTFKLVTAAGLLEARAVRPSDVFFAENGRADLDYAVISDAHPYGYLTFKEGFIYSSNIVFAKASLKISPSEFYKFIRLFGFGARTGIELLGESPGSISPVDKWSKRSQATMAFGHEIAATPLQMLNAFAAVANGGELLAPTIVKAVVDEDNPNIPRKSPIRIRNVISRNTAQTLKSFCRDVVREGTGKAAEVKELEVCGKTGTGQKASKRGGYLPRKYVASFVGFLPFQDPRIVGLVLIDEPVFGKRFGAVSAAPVFARIARALSYSTDLLDDVLLDDVVKQANRGKKRRKKTPNFLRMKISDARAMAERRNIKILCSSLTGRVIGQDPDPETSISDGEVVELCSDDPKDMNSNNVPDYRGLTMRDAKRKIVARGWKVSMQGSGIVKSQSPSPGAANKYKSIKLRCSK